MSPASDRFVSKSRSRSSSAPKKRSSRGNGNKSGSPLPGRSTSRSASRDTKRKPRRSNSRSQERNKRAARGTDRINPEPNCCIGVFGLSPRTTEDDLYEIFDRYGKIERLHLVTDRYTKESRGYCFINYVSVDCATKAVSKADGMEIDGRPIRADFSITQRPHTPTPGQYMGKRTDRPRERGYDDRDRFRDRDRGYDEPRRDRDRRRSRTRSPVYRRRRSRSGSLPYRRNRSRSNDRSRRRNGY